jgi:hypothetical protein
MIDYMRHRKLFFWKDTIYFKLCAHESSNFFHRPQYYYDTYNSDLQIFAHSILNWKEYVNLKHKLVPITDNLVLAKLMLLNRGLR